MEPDKDDHRVGTGQTFDERVTMSPMVVKINATVPPATSQCAAARDITPLLYPLPDEMRKGTQKNEGKKIAEETIVEAWLGKGRRARCGRNSRGRLFLVLYHNSLPFLLTW